MPGADGRDGADPTIRRHGGAAANRAALPWWKSRATLNWLVPATAAATALALWVAVPGQRTPATEERQAEIQTAATPPPELRLRRPWDVDALRPAIGRARRQPGSRQRERAPHSAPPRPRTRSRLRPLKVSLKQDENRLGRQEGVASEQARVQRPEPDRSLLDRAAPLAAARAAAPAAAGFEVVSPDPLVRWRVGPGVSRSVLRRRRLHLGRRRRQARLRR